MKKCLVWGMGKIFYENICLVKYHESLGHFKVTAVSSNNAICSVISGYPVVKPCYLKNINFDFVIIISKDKYMKQMYDEVIEMGISETNIISYKC